MEEQQIGLENQEVDSKSKQEIKKPISPPSSSSNSPSHEFSFTISLHSSSTTTTPMKTSTTAVVPADKTISPFAVDLSPADDIFFHGHLLPLHLLSNFPVSPRSSIDSSDNFTLPIKELTGDRDDHQNPTKIINHHHKPITKSKTFSLFGLKSWKKECHHQDSIQDQEQDHQEHQREEKTKRKQRYDITNVLKRYAKMVRPVFMYKGRRRDADNGGKLHKQANSFSGNLSLRHTKQEVIRGRRGDFSAPASMRTSPSNSGLLVNYDEHTQMSTNDSTMEELQSAIQAAIAHCKNSIAVQDNPKS